MDTFSNICHNCGNELTIKTLGCAGCGLAVSGDIELPRLARLSPEDRQFIELFVLSGGSLKEVGKILNLSYPTVRNRLDKVIEHLQNLDQARKTLRSKIIAALERGEITSAEAVKQLNQVIREG